MSPSIPKALLEYYRCPAALPDFGVVGELSAQPGHFSFREERCYGRSVAAPAAVATPVRDVSHDVEAAGGRVRLPFDLSEVVTNLRLERYVQRPADEAAMASASAVCRRIYYLLRPLMPVAVRKHLQRMRLSGWERIPFPRWPVDCGVDNLMAGAMELALRSGDVDRIPFVWFWPDGAPSATIVTHDVESRPGQQFCDTLMDIDDSFGVKSSFQLVPETRYRTSKCMFDRLRARGFEANIHDLNHDGHLFDSRRQFRERAARISEYARTFESRGFRTGGMYREQDWFEALDISYDMSVPNVAHMEPQRGGCCTVMPYFNGKIVELPLTTVQDYSLFHILRDYSTALWKEQIGLIEARHGLITILTHPDYLIEMRARAVYRRLLDYIRQLRQSGRTWLALPGEVDRWWRNRNAMTVVRDGHGWRVEGPDRERARVAYAVLDRDRLVYLVSAT